MKLQGILIVFVLVFFLFRQPQQITNDVDGDNLQDNIRDNQGGAHIKTTFQRTTKHLNLKRKKEKYVTQLIQFVIDTTQILNSFHFFLFFFLLVPTNLVEVPVANVEDLPTFIEKKSTGIKGPFYTTDAMEDCKFDLAVVREAVMWYKNTVPELKELARSSPRKKQDPQYEFAAGFGEGNEEEELPEYGYMEHK